HDSQVDSLASHPRKQFEDAHRLGNEQRLAHQGVKRAVTRRIDVRDEDVLDVNHADDFIEALAIDGQTAVPRVGERAHEIVEADRRGYGANIAASHATVARGL